MANEPAGVAAIETHLSEVFLGHERVYKRLKPVKFPFVDFSTSALRCAAAEEEFRKNKAISPSVYLGLADVVENGQLADRLIVMRRLRVEDQLTGLLNRPDAGQVVRSVARRVARMHMGQPCLREEESQPASSEAISQHWEENFVALEPVVGTIIDAASHERVMALARSWIGGRTQLLHDRIDAGWIRDGHGDLRAEHVYCADEGVELIDCVAFDKKLRIADVLSDVAFLAMDLERLAGPGASLALMRAWGEFTGESHPSSLAHFYVAYRAHVRAKVAAIRFGQGDDLAANEVASYHALCLRHLELATVRVVMVGGGPGTGKSTVSAGVAQSLGGAWLRADEIRKDLACISHDDHAFAEPGEGIYSAAMSLRTFDELRYQAQALLARGVSVVVDATWQSAADRAMLRDVAASAGAELTELRCDLSPAVAKERIARRLASLHEPSDALPALVEYIGARFEPWPEAKVVDTSRSVDSSIAAALLSVLGPSGSSDSSQTSRAQAEYKADLRELILIVGAAQEQPQEQQGAMS